MGTPLAKVREKRLIPQIQVARHVGIDKGHYSNIESGKATPSAAVAARIAAFFGHEVTEIQILYPERYVETTVA